VTVPPPPAPTPSATEGLVRKVVIATLLGALVFAGLSFYGNVQELRHKLDHYAWGYFVAAIALASSNYALRFLRWQYYLGRVGQSVPWRPSLVIFLSGFVMSVTPAKVGEVLKSLLLYESRGISIARTAPIVIAERLTDLIALVLLTSVGTLAFAQGLPVAIGGAAAVTLLWLLCAFRPLGELAFAIAERIPFLDRAIPKLREAYESMQVLVGPAPLALATLLAVASWSLECVCLWTIVRGFEGVLLDGISATFAYSAPTIAGALALMPGGLGVTEAGMTGVLQTLGGAEMTPAVATAVTMLVRIATLWWAVVLGVVALGVFRRSEAARHPAPTRAAG